MNIDERFSRVFFERVHKSRFMKHVAIFCASYLIWLMAGFVVGQAFPAVYRIIPILFFPWGVTLFLSEWIRRPRPFHPEHYRPLIHLWIETPSFPSAHSTLAFSMLAAFINDFSVWPILLIAAIFVALGRVAVGVHYASDVLIGAFLGFGLGYTMHVAAVVLSLFF